jgi:TetR/AcrR family transcriptional regulator, transcriptional repressor for nem operon
VARPSLREQLLSAGLETFHRRGFNATSVQDITDAAGAPKGSFYNHFESKEALAVEAVRKYRERGRLRMAILQETKLPPLRRLRKYFENYVELIVEGEFKSGCLLGNFASEMSSQSQVVRDEVAGSFDRWCEEIAKVIGEAQKSGAVSASVAPKALAEFVIHSWEGAMLRAKVEKDRAPLDLFVKLTFSKILA